MKTWTYVVLAIVVMFLLGVFGGIVWDKSDWIFLVLIIGIVLLNTKLNRIIELLQEKPSGKKWKKVKKE